MTGKAEQHRGWLGLNQNCVCAAFLCFPLSFTLPALYFLILNKPYPFIAKTFKCPTFRHVSSRERSPGQRDLTPVDVWAGRSWGWDFGSESFPHCGVRFGEASSHSVFPFPFNVFAL